MSSKSVCSVKTMVVAAASLLVSPYVVASTASAEGESLGLEEIIVTATRQATASQDTALALTAVSGEDLQRQGVTSLTELDRVAPNLFIQDGLAGGSPRFSLRGISTQDITFGGSSPVAIYFDDVYQTALYGTSMQLFDIARVEVLRGPQGTLFGKNTTGGALSYFSNEPVNKEEGYFSFRLGLGDQTIRNVEAAVNVPLVDNVLALRLSGKAERKGDYIDDVYLGRSYGSSDAQAIRGQLKWTPTDRTTVNLSLAADDHNGDPVIPHVQYLDSCNLGSPQNNGAALYLCGPFQLAPKPAPPADSAHANSVALTDQELAEDFDNQSATLHINQAFDGFNVTSITHYKRGHYLQISDAEGAPGDYLQLRGKLYNQQIGEELRVATDADRRVSAVVGAYYQHDRVQVNTSYASTSNPNPFGFSSAPDPAYDYLQTQAYANYTDTYALFGTVTFKVTDDLSLVGGIRKSDERRKRRGYSNYWFSQGNPRVNPARPIIDFTQSNVWPNSEQPYAPDAQVILDPSQPDSHIKVTPLTWDATVNYRPMEDMLLFVRAAKGFRSGGFNVPGFLNPDAGRPAFDPEYIRSYELGIKSEFLNHSLRVNATAYHYDYTDQQVAIFQLGSPITQNAGKSKVDGVELEVKALPVRALELGLNASYNKARYSDYHDDTLGFNYKGNTLVQAPKWTAGVMVAYTVDVGSRFALRSSTNWTYRSEVFFDPSNDPALRSPALTQGSVRFDLVPQSDKGVSIGVYADNVTNKKYITYAYGLPTVLNDYYFSTGLKYGLEMRYDW